MNKLLTLAVLSSLVWGGEIAAQTPRPVPFAQPSLERPLSLPADHGAHPQFRTEWWYFTGHLVPQGRSIFESPERIGFQLTFFRSARRPDSANLWHQRFLAHGALSLLDQGRFLHEARLGAAPLGTAHAALGQLLLHTKGWSAELRGDQLQLAYSLSDGDTTVEIDLSSKGPVPPAVLQGPQGVSTKGPCAVCQSYYYSIPRIPLRGTIRAGSKHQVVDGLAWMDHEYMSSALLPSQVGWDWISLMLEDGRDLMLFRVRSASPEAAWMSGSVSKRGETRLLSARDFTLQPGRTWRSPVTNAAYPVVWQVEIPSEGLSFGIEAMLDTQEVADRGVAESPSYWEGAVRTRGVTGIGYLEMTGYDKPIGGQF